MIKNIDLVKINKKRDSLIENFNNLQDKKKETLNQIELIDTDILTVRGAILLCNEWVEELEPSKKEEKDG
jgi:hypothetical protein